VNSLAQHLYHQQVLNYGSTLVLELAFFDRSLVRREGFLLGLICLYLPGQVQRMPIKLDIAINLKREGGPCGTVGRDIRRETCICQGDLNGREGPSRVPSSGRGMLGLWRCHFPGIDLVMVVLWKRSTW